MQWWNYIVYELVELSRVRGHFPNFCYTSTISSKSDKDIIRKVQTISVMNIDINIPNTL